MCPRDYWNVGRGWVWAQRLESEQLGHGGSRRQWHCWRSDRTLLECEVPAFMRIINFSQSPCHFVGEDDTPELGTPGIPSSLVPCSSYNITVHLNFLILVWIFSEPLITGMSIFMYLLLLNTIGYWGQGKGSGPWLRLRLGRTGTLP